MTLIFIMNTNVQHISMEDLEVFTLTIEASMRLVGVELIIWHLIQDDFKCNKCLCMIAPNKTWKGEWSNG